jgi:hypothetical protein
MPSQREATRRAGADIPEGSRAPVLMADSADAVSLARLLGRVDPLHRSFLEHPPDTASSADSPDKAGPRVHRPTLALQVRDKAGPRVQLSPAALQVRIGPAAIAPPTAQDMVNIHRPMAGELTVEGITGTTFRDTTTGDATTMADITEVIKGTTIVDVPLMEQPLGSSWAESS